MSQKNPAPLALEWLVFIRDHGLDLKVTLGERALASLLPTYGQGTNIYVSTAKLAKITGWSENTVRKHRNGLIAKELLEDITGDPDRQLRTYRLAMPGYVEPPQNLTPSPSVVEGVPPQNLTPSPSESEPYIKLVDQEKRSSSTSSGPDDDDHESGPSADSQGQSQKQAPSGPDGEPGDLELDDSDKEYLAGLLGLTPGAIGQNFWDWFLSQWRAARAVGPGREAVFEVALGTAADAAIAGRNPPGYFMTLLPQHVERIFNQEVDGTWTASDDCFVDWVITKLRTEYEAPETFQPWDVGVWIDTTFNRADATSSRSGLINRALDRMARVGYVTDNRDGTFSFTYADDDA
jgi:hypothetical protein